MNPNDLAPLIGGVTLILSIAAVLIFRPLTKKLGDRIGTPPSLPPPPIDTSELTRVRQALEETTARLERIEQRLDFTERLLSTPRERAAATTMPPAITQPSQGMLPPQG